MEDERLVKHVVLDSGAFLRNAPIQNIGEKMYTIPEIVKEIRDKATKQRLQVLPYELIFREPSAEAIRTVTEFAKKTGDYGSLSAVDIRVMALTYQIEKENVGVEHLKTAPEKKVEWNCRNRNLEKATDIAGFYVKPKKSPASRTTSECSTKSETDSLTHKHAVDSSRENLKPVCENLTDSLTSEQTVDSRKETVEPVNELVDTEPVNSQEQNIENQISDSSKQESSVINTGVTACDTKSASVDEKDESENENHTENQSRPGGLEDGQIFTADQLEEGSDDDGEDDDDDDDDDDGGWITPSNIKNMKAKMGAGDTERASVPVGCLTTDFAMQNVLIQMGLNVISVDGMLIKRAKSYVLRCFACMKITTNVQKVFCPHCGNKTLTKVSMTVNEDGSIRYFLSKRPISKKNTNMSIPMFRGGKHANNPHLFEDQPAPQQRTAKKAQGVLDVLDPDYIANQSPFMLNDVTSRASQLGIRSKKGQSHWDRRNPNVGRKKRK